MSVSASIYGEGNDAHAGYSTATEDVDGDGVVELMVGAPGFTVAHGQEGSAFLFSGPVSGSMLVSDADATFPGTYAYEEVGTSVHLSDMNGDGLADLLVGGPGSTGSMPGGVYVMFSPITGSKSLSSSSAILEGEQAGDESGIAIMTDDVNGDGELDILVGGSSAGAGREGAWHVVSGPVSGTFSLSTADAIIVGEAGSDGIGYGYSVADTDADLKADLLLGAYQNDSGGTSAGAAYLVLGSELGL